jgi:hypothetical protein
MPMRLIYPRPDGETSAHARHKWAYPNMLYEIPIGIQGGNWPFKYEIITAPVGATIGTYYDRTKRGLLNEYGIVKWTPTASSGSYTFTVRVTDSDGSIAEATWIVVIDINMFIFVDSNALISGVGTIASPLKLFSDWYKNNVNDATYHNKIIVFRGGTYILVGDTVNGNPNAFLNSSTKTSTLMQYPGEVAKIDYTNGKFLTNTAMPDLFISLGHTNARNDVANAHYFWLTNKCDRSTFFKNHFDGMSYGTAGTDNPGCIFWADLNTGVHHINVLIKDNLFEGINTHTGEILANGHYWDAYQTDYLLSEGNVSKDSYTTYGHWAKATSSFVTIRNNDMFDNCQGLGATLGQSSATDVVPNNHEVCWNNFQVPFDQSLPVFEVATSNAYLGQHYNTYVYKNSFIGGYTMVRYPGTANYEFDANVILTNNLAQYDTTIITTVLPNYISTVPANFTADGYPKDTTTWFYAGHQVN